MARHKVITAISIVVLVLIVMGVIGSATGGKGGPNKLAATRGGLSPTQVPTYSPPYSPPAPVPSPTLKSASMVFRVWGTGLPSIQYGSDSDSRSPAGGLGPLGDGVRLPWTAKMGVTKHAIGHTLYWAIDAQLEGGGSIKCSITLVATFSDGTHGRKVLARGHASGGYNICSAQYNNN